MNVKIFKKQIHAKFVEIQETNKMSIRSHETILSLIFLMNKIGVVMKRREMKMRKYRGSRCTG